MWHDCKNGYSNLSLNKAFKTFYLIMMAVNIFEHDKALFSLFVLINWLDWK